jgi:glycogen operon protein
MLLAGDELGHSQHGNNNAYCQDNEISWLNWTADSGRDELFEFTRRMIALRRAHPVLHRRHFFEGRALNNNEVKDILWLQPDGSEMTDEEWRQDFARCLGALLSGDAITETDARGRLLKDDDFLVLFNAHHEEIPFVLPEFIKASQWRPLLDSRDPLGDVDGTPIGGGESYVLMPRSLVILTRVRQRLPTL